MKLQIESDTHEQKEITVHSEADVLVIAGDYSNGSMESLKEIERLADQIQVVYVPGNHDLQTFCRANNLTKEDSFDLIYNYFDKINVPCLREGMEFNYNGKTFVGGTLFTDYDLFGNVELNKLKSLCVGDFKRIYKNGRLITPNDYVDIHRKQVKWISKYRNRKDVVVVTHFVPNEAALDPRYQEPRNEFLNPYFVNNISLRGFNTWICGHTHTAFDEIVQGCRLVINPFGHHYERGINGFKDQKIIRI